MSRLEKYINEAAICIEDREEFAETVRKECAQALRVMKKSGITFTRSMGWSDQPDHFKHKTYRNRKPRDSSIEAHNLANEFFKKKFGWKARSENVVFAYVRRLVHMRTTWYPNIFPIGKFKVVWSPNTSDMYKFDGMEYPKLGDLQKEILLDDFEAAEYTNKMPDRRAVNNEIMIGCKEYYGTRDFELVKRLIYG